MAALQSPLGPLFGCGGCRSYDGWAKAGPWFLWAVPRPWASCCGSCARIPTHRCGSLMRPRVVLPCKLLLFDRMVNLMTLLPWYEKLNGWLCELWRFASAFHRRWCKPRMQRIFDPEFLFSAYSCQCFFTVFSINQFFLDTMFSWAWGVLSGGDDLSLLF